MNWLIQLCGAGFAWLGQTWLSRNVTLVYKRLAMPAAMARAEEVKTMIALVDQRVKLCQTATLLNDPKTRDRLLEEQIRKGSQTIDAFGERTGDRVRVAFLVHVLRLVKRVEAPKNALPSTPSDEA